jgi:hypothetical protein
MPIAPITRKQKSKYQLVLFACDHSLGAIFDELTSILRDSVESTFGEFDQKMKALSYKSYKRQAIEALGKIIRKNSKNTHTTMVQDRFEFLKQVQTWRDKNIQSLPTLDDYQKEFVRCFARAPWVAAEDLYADIDMQALVPNFDGQYDAIKKQFDTEQVRKLLMWSDGLSLGELKILKSLELGKKKSKSHSLSEFSKMIFNVLDKEKVTGILGFYRNESEKKQIIEVSANSLKEVFSAGLLLPIGSGSN